MLVAGDGGGAGGKVAIGVVFVFCFFLFSLSISLFDSSSFCSLGPEKRSRLLVRFSQVLSVLISFVLELALVYQCSEI